MSGNDELANALGVGINEDQGLALNDLTDSCSMVAENNPSEEDLRKIRVVYWEDETVRRAKEISECIQPGAHAIFRLADSSDDVHSASIPSGLGVPVLGLVPPIRVNDQPESVSVDSGLVTASPVKEPCQVAELFTSAPRNNKGQRQRQYNILCCPGAATGIVTALVLVMVFVYWLSGKDEKTPPETPSPAPRVPLDERIRKILPKFTLLNLAEGSNSHQMRAFQWLMEDPKVEQYEDWRILQRFAMATIYYATAGEDWLDNTYWVSHEKHENVWHSATSFDIHNFNHFTQTALENVRTAKDEIVTHLWLFKNGLKGTLPAEISLLTSLVSLDISHNNLRGTIPTQLGNLENLIGFFGQMNELSGGIPSEFGLIRDLHFLSIFTNQLTGTLPTEIGLPRLWTLLGNNNNFTGPIPSEFGQLTELGLLMLEQCNLSSTIPSELGRLTALQIIQLQHNDLTGAIPSELGLLKMASLDLSPYYDDLLGILLPENLATSFGGSFRPMIGAAAEAFRRNEVHFGSNKLTGSIPSELTRLAFRLKYGCKGYLDPGERLCNGLTLEHNSLTGNLPVLSPTLMHINIGHNFLTGTIPHDLGFGAIEHFDVGNNKLTGSVPVESSEWPHLEFFDISNNLMITGIIPNDLCVLPTGLNFSCSPVLCGCDDCPCQDG